MLLSMTGHGEARAQSDALKLSVEIRSVNNRYLKLSLRAPEPFNLFEAEFERVVRRSIRRGTILLQLRVERPFTAHDYRLNAAAIQSYVEQVRHACRGIEPSPNVDALLGQVLALPGVATEPGATAASAEAEWPAIERVVVEALERLQTFRRGEGERMARELLQYCSEIGERLASIKCQVPKTVVGLRDRLLDRVRSLLAETGARIESADLIREVAVVAERSDVAEETVRLASHLEQFERTVRTETDAPGRKLDFLVQEMGRETNTIGSKASDVEVTRQVVEIKATLEKVRELIQNVE